eukprot:1151612-Pelagomonas_calceolata.AAC.2
MLVEKASPAADQPESRAVGQPLVNLATLNVHSEAKKFLPVGVGGLQEVLRVGWNMKQLL